MLKLLKKREAGKRTVFLNGTPLATESRPTTDNLDVIELKSFCSVKDAIT